MCLKSGGAKQDRTADLLRAKQALSQLSYSPTAFAVLAGLILGAENGFIKHNFRFF